MSGEIYIRPSRDVRTNYAEISALCKKHPVAVTVNGREDCVMMSHEQYNAFQAEMARLTKKLELYAALAAAEEDIKAGRVYPAEEAFGEIAAELKKSDFGSEEK